MSSLSSVSSIPLATSTSTSTSYSSSAPSYSAVTATQITNASTTLTKLTADAASLSARATNYGTIEASLQALKAATKLLENGSQVAGITASSSSPLVTPTVGNNAVAGSYTVNVSNLATAQINTSSSAATTTAAAAKGTGTLGIQVGSGSVVNVSITNTMTLTDITNAINNANAGVTAAIGGSSGAYTVVVTGNNTGAANAVTYTQSGVTLNFSSTQNQAAQNANYTINGKAYSATYNNAAYGIPGTVLALSGTVSNAVVTLGANATAVQTAVTSLVSSYNAALTAIDSVTSAQGAIEDPLLVVIKRQLTDMVGNVSTGASGTYSSLASVGITRNSDSTLTINSNVLSGALTTSAQSVAALVSGNSTCTTGLAAGLYAIARTFAEPGVGTFDKVGFKQARQSLNLSRSITAQQRYVDYANQTAADQYTSLQVALSQLNATSLIVQTLTAQLGIQTSSNNTATSTSS